MTQLLTLRHQPRYLLTVADPYNTNLAAEFFVMSTLHRLGFDAFLSLGNKKGVDIAIASPGKLTISIEVKGVAGKHDWRVNNAKVVNSAKHFYALVSFEGSIADPTAMPRVWILPSDRLPMFLKTYGAEETPTIVVSRPVLVRDGKAYLHAWHLIRAEASL